MSIVFSKIREKLQALHLTPQQSMLIEQFETVFGNDNISKVDLACLCTNAELTPLDVYDAHKMYICFDMLVGTTDNDIAINIYDSANALQRSIQFIGASDTVTPTNFSRSLNVDNLYFSRVDNMAKVIRFVGLVVTLV